MGIQYGVFRKRSLRQARRNNHGIEEDDYLDAIRQAGFSDVQVVARIDYDAEVIRALGTAESVPEELVALAPSLAEKVSSIKISATKA